MGTRGGGIIGVVALGVGSFEDFELVGLLPLEPGLILAVTAKGVSSSLDSSTSCLRDRLRGILSGIESPGIAELSPSDTVEADSCLNVFLVSVTGVAVGERRGGT